MIKLEDMSILEKVSKLESFVAKADLDDEYRRSIVLGDQDYSEFKAYAKTLIANARTLFAMNRIDDLEYNARAEAFGNYNVSLDQVLKKFPEYAQNDIITESVIEDIKPRLH